MSASPFSQLLLAAIEKEIQRQVSRLDEPYTQTFHEMMTYHLGWTGDGSGPTAQGKRIRPLLLLLSCSACQGKWINALPAAAAVELVHNFSLVHDDIQDHSETRRGRETVWKIWGVPQGINAGDALFVLSNLAVTDLSTTFPPAVILETSQKINQTCLDLTRGQFQDISFEDREIISILEYWQMIEGKTAALISTCCDLGALLGGTNSDRQADYRAFGRYLGLAFQVQDDILGIWGNSQKTGKSVSTDLVTGKKSLPILFGLEKKAKFYTRWIQGSIHPEEASELGVLLAEEGALDYSKQKVEEMTNFAISHLHKASPQGEAGEMLFRLVENLFNRDL